MQRIHNLSKWQYVETSMVFDNPVPRLVKIEVNCPERTAFFVHRNKEDVDQDGERQRDLAAGRDTVVQSDTVFLGLAEGRDGFEFWVEGAFKLDVSEPCWLFTIDSMRIARRDEAPVIFTRIANRRQRNPHLEMIEFQMRRNTERRMQELAAEMERRITAAQEGKLDRYLAERQTRKPATLAGIQPTEEHDDDASKAPVRPSGKDADKSGEGGKPAKSGKAAAAGDDGGKKAKAD